MDETLPLFSRHLPRTRSYRFYRISCTIFSIQIFTQIFIPSSRERVKITAFSIKPIEPERCTVSPRISIVYGTKYIEAGFTSDTLPPSFLCCSLIDAHREKGIRASPRERGRERGETRKCVIYVYILDVGTVVAANKSRANRKREDGSETKSVRAREREREREREGRVSEGNLVIELANSLYCVYKECYA